MAEKKKILYIVEAMGGGVFTYIVDLANELVNKYDMYIAYAVRKQTPKNYKDYFDKRIHLIEVKNFGRAIDPVKDIAALFEVKKIAAKIKPDVIHLHSCKAGAIGRVAFNGKIPMFYTPHGYSFLMENYKPMKRRMFKMIESVCAKRNCTTISCSVGEHAKRKNLLMGSNPIIAPDSEMLWNAAIVWRILRRYEYTGALVMGRRKKIDVNTTSVRTLPEDKWIIAENAHAAIVTKDEYYQAQKAIRNVTPIQYKVGDDFALKGKICCGNCNRQLRHERQYGEMVFYCGYKRSAGKFSKCYGGYYREYSVNAKVARAIKTVFYALDVVNQGMQEKQSITVRCMDIEDLEKQAEAIRVEQIKLYESYADGVLRRDAYIEKKKALSEKLAALQDSIRTEKEEQECADELDEEIRALTKQASEKTYIGGLTKECVDAFVSMVYLYDDQTMKIEFNCEDVIRRALEKYGA